MLSLAGTPWIEIVPTLGISGGAARTSPTLLGFWCAREWLAVGLFLLTGLALSGPLPPDERSGAGNPEASQDVTSTAGRTESTERRVESAKRSAEAGELDAAIEELRSVLAEDPTHWQARVQLARYLSWNGRLRESIREADRVLAAEPDQREALLIKSDAALWSGDRATAVASAERVLSSGEDFEAQLALGHALADAGDLRGAREAREGLEPSSDSEQREIAKLDREIARRSAPTVSTQIVLYDDTDNNRRRQASIGASTVRGNLATSVELGHGRAKDDARDFRFSSLWLRGEGPLDPAVQLTGGVGLSRVDANGVHYTPTGYVAAQARLGATELRAGLARNVLTDTAQIIENRIKITELSLAANQAWGDRFSPSLRYLFRTYSDDNHASNYKLTLPYALRLSRPRISAGYRYDHLHFDKQTRSGYFDPSRLTANHALISIAHNVGNLNANLEAFVGNQDTRRFGIANHESIAGVYGALSYRVTRDVTLSLQAEGSNSSIGSASGFRYYQVSAGLSVAF